MSLPSLEGVPLFLWLTSRMAGDWRGNAHIIAADGSSQDWPITTRNNHVGEYCVQRETFTTPTGKVNSVKVLMAEPVSGKLHISYFSGQSVRPYTFAFVEADVTDEKHWSVTVQSPQGAERYDGRPAIMRYIRARHGDNFTLRKDVRYEDDDAVFVTRSHIKQELCH